MQRRITLLATSLLAVLCALSGSAPVPMSRTAVAGSIAEQPCGWRTVAPQSYDHVVWVVLENHS